MPQVVRASSRDDTVSRFFFVSRVTCVAVYIHRFLVGRKKFGKFLVWYATVFFQDAANGRSPSFATGG